VRRKKIRAKAIGQYKSTLESKIHKRLPKGSQYEDTKVKYFIPKTYTPDFTVTTKSGQTFFLEVKGYFRYEDQQKMRHVMMCNPELDIRMYFPNDNKIQGSTMTNSQWCEKYGFKYAIGRFPRGWFR